MKREWFERIKSEFEKEKEQNNEQILINSKRAKLSQLNQFELKAQLTLAFSMLGYIGLVVAWIILTKIFDITTITNIIPAEIFPVVLSGGSLAIGTIINKMVYKKQKIKEKFKAFSNSKTQTDKLEELVHYQTELQKTYNRNRVIDETINILNSNQSVLSKISSRYDLIDRNSPKTEEEAKQSIKELSSFIKERYEQLDLLTTKEVLHNKFGRVKPDFYDTGLILTSSMMIGLGTVIAPVGMLKDFITNGSLFVSMCQLVVLMPVVGSSVYIIKRRKEHKKAFNKLNAQLENNILTDKLDKSIDTQIRELSLALVQLKEQEKTLETLIEEETKTNVNNQDLEKTTQHITEEEIRLNQLESPEQFILGTALDISETVDELEPQEKGPSLVKRRYYTNPNDKK